MRLFRGAWPVAMQSSNFWEHPSENMVTLTSLSIAMINTTSTSGSARGHYMQPIRQEPYVPGKQLNG
jgi:hypothetical protein